MSLSQREQMILKGIEDELARQDPGLSARLAQINASRRWRHAVPPALLTFALGIALMVYGAIAAAPRVAWAGVAVAMTASCWLLLVVARLLHRRRPG